MGLRSGFLSDLCKRVVHEKKYAAYIEPANAEETLKNTTSLFIDFTQLLHSIKVSEEDLICRDVEEYKTASSFLNSSSAIGELNFGDGSIKNTVDTFSMDQVVHLVINKIVAVQRQWKTACSSVGITCPLKTVFLLMDGDSPSAKYSTLRKRKHCKQNPIVNRFSQRLAMDGMVALPSAEEVEKIVSSKIAMSSEPISVECPEYKGSVRFFLQRRKNQHAIATEIATLLSQSQLPLFGDYSMYMIVGKSKEFPMGKCSKLCGSLNHPAIPSFGGDIPYKEADLLVPYIWSKVSTYENCACIISKDSDMLTSMLALADPKLALLVKTNDAPNDYSIFPGNVALRVLNQVTEMPRKQLELMLHITMGGSDYVETYPRCGPMTILRGMENFEHYPSLFPNVQFVKWCDLSVLSWREANAIGSHSANDAVCFEVSKLEEGGHQLLMMRRIIRMEEKYFPIRLGNNVYLMEYESLHDRQPREWYAKQCPTNTKKEFTKIQKQKFDNNVFASKFTSSMKRRLFFLSMMSDSRGCLENDMDCEPNLSLKCGYDSTKDFSYVDPMSLTEVSVCQETKDGEQL